MAISPAAYSEKHMDQFTSVFQQATAAVGEDYILLPVVVGPPVYLERVYCYELYHQMRCRWHKMPDGYVLNGEVWKGSNRIISNLVGTVMPDFIVHHPGEMEHNYAIVEVKRASPWPGKDEIANDLRKLTEFTSMVLYERAIYLFFGVDAQGEGYLADAVAAGVRYMRPRRPLELWVHGKGGTEARCIRRFRG